MPRGVTSVPVTASRAIARLVATGNDSGAVAAGWLESASGDSCGPAADVVDEQQRDAVAGGERGGVDVVLHDLASGSALPIGLGDPARCGATRPS